MPRGATCPGCGELTWHADQKTGLRRCSNDECGAVGWIGGETPTPAARAPVRSCARVNFASISLTSSADCAYFYPKGACWS